MTHPDAQATAIAWDDEVLAVGGDEEIRRLAHQHGVRVEDGQGRVILPGFVDGHMHFLHVGLKRTRPDLRGASSRQEALERVATWLAAHPGDDPVTGEGWDESDWPDARPFYRQDLDAVSGDRPVVLRRICGHVAVANSAALPAIRARWDDPALVDAATGRLLEAPSLYLNEVLPASPPQLAAAVQEATRVAHALGVTAIGDYEQAPLRQALVDAARQGRLGVRVACSIYLQHLEQAVADGFRTGRRHTDMLFDAGLKLFLDGSIGGHTAHMLDPYSDQGGTGMANFDDAQLDAAMERAHAAGVQIHAHAIGDGAIEQGLRAFERLAARTALEQAGTQAASAPNTAPEDDGSANDLSSKDGGENATRDTTLADDGLEEAGSRHGGAAGPGGRLTGLGGEGAELGGRGTGPGGEGAELGGRGTGLGGEAAGLGGRSTGLGGGGTGRRGGFGVPVDDGILGHRFEHFEISRDEQIARCAALGVWASSQPNFVGEWSAAGGMYEQRMGSRYRLNNRFQTIRDAGMRLAFGSDGMPFGPLFGIQCAMQHPDPAQRSDVRQAIWHYTHEAAASLGHPEWGSLRPGSTADLLILEQTDLEAPPTTWVIQETIVGGKTVHRGSVPQPTDDDVDAKGGASQAADAHPPSLGNQGRPAT